MADRIDVLLISPLATVRAGLAALLREDDSIRVVGQAASLASEAAADLLPEHGLLLLDAASADEAADAVALLDGAGLGLVVLGPPGVSGSLMQAAPSFAWAYLSRDAASDRIVAAVHAVAAGLVAFELEAGALPLPARAAGPLPADDEIDDLTAREREVLTLVAIGLTNKAIAQRLTISDHTVKFHVAAILAKLGAESRTEAVHLAARRGLLTL
jgi:DNA-binding NarL/FixJ family response regulator